MPITGNVQINAPQGSGSCATAFKLRASSPHQQICTSNPSSHPLPITAGAVLRLPTAHQTYEILWFTISGTAFPMKGTFQTISVSI